MILERAKRVLEIEARAVAGLKERLNDEFVRAVELILRCEGKVVVTGVGKSGIIGKKIASTLASTGTPAFFLHPTEGVHGDLGMLDRRDVVLAISRSGETEELSQLLPLIKRQGNRLIAFTGNPSSSLAKAADVVIDVGVDQEACPLGLAPTASTTAALAMGDALAVALLEERGFRREDFARLHPGGVLGRRLLLRVRDLMHVGEEFPRVWEETSMKEVLVEMTSKRLGVTAVMDGGGRLVGVITDGDLRRALERYPDLLQRRASEIMTRNPKGIEADALAAEAVKRMEEHSITSLFVFERPGDRVPVGIIHLHDLLKAGVV
ncbi:MAG: D-arabinose 5-phosphate isomerase [Deltaproteobacteria bacterium]|nr:MAG: D-arabinose 5-phosphate isomerase [Deltaproteobacteria bacterium]RLB03051.1 MAG: D-arabinose 5-phosphate isomerase [Deltaproteobacteria bacterium]